MKMSDLNGAVAAIAVGCCLLANAKSEPINFARAELEPFVEKGQLAGAISYLYDNGREEIATVGFADVAAKRRIAMDQVFMQCSQTKPYCGVTVAKLVEEGRLKLDDPIEKYLPEFRTTWYFDTVSNDVKTIRKSTNKITVRMCLNHMAGFDGELAYHERMGGWSRRMPLRSVAAVAAAYPLAYNPGTKIQYSNVGIEVGAAVVEVVTGMRWEKYLQKTVLDPLGMKDTTFWPSEKQLKNRILVYAYDKKLDKAVCQPVQGDMQPPYNDDRVFASAAAGLWTTANDQIKFHKMLMNLGVGDNGVRILKEKTVKSILALNTRKFVDGQEVRAGLGYSLGLKAPIVDGEDQTVGHGGAWGSQGYVNWHRRQLKLFVVQRCGTVDTPWKDAWDKAVDKFLKHKNSNKGEGDYTNRLFK